nr:hypothetical protein Itr_chr02CG03480 [Ipomoea trifida]GLL39580.1 hypothetical protein Itr_chr11CG14130 [Ipomoea trifida]GLL42729.1 hypothetical protein Itr_chr12CG24980 [Ipomoea trifida]
MFGEKPREIRVGNSDGYQVFDAINDNGRADGRDGDVEPRTSLTDFTIKPNLPSNASPTWQTQLRDRTGQLLLLCIPIFFLADSLRGVSVSRFTGGFEAGGALEGRSGLIRSQGCVGKNPALLRRIQI